MLNTVPQGKSSATRLCLDKALDICDNQRKQIEDLQQWNKTSNDLVESRLQENDLLREVLRDPDQLTEAMRKVCPERLMKKYRDG